MPCGQICKEIIDNGAKAKASIGHHREGLGQVLTCMTTSVLMRDEAPPAELVAAYRTAFVNLMDGMKPLADGLALAAQNIASWATPTA